MIKLLLSISVSLVIIIIIFSASVIIPASLTLGKLENIHGIPFATIDHQTHINEPLAHIDVYLNQPVFARTLELTISYLPNETSQIMTGVRENSFWLSYNPQTIYNVNTHPTFNNQTKTSIIDIPLTDKLQEPNRSIDLMFFANPDTANWEIINIKARTKLSIPSTTMLIDYIKSILKRQRAL